MGVTHDLAALIVTHHRADLALACRQALVEDVSSEEIVVVVNDPSGCRAEELDLLRESGCRLVLNEQPRGYGANINAGAAVLAPRFRYLLLLNDDTVPRRGAVAAIVRTIRDQPASRLVGGQLVDPNGNIMPSAFRFPSIASELANAIMLPARWQSALRRRLCFPDVRSAPVAVDWVIGAALLVEADSFRAVGGFDEDFFLYSEEIDLAYRLRERGWLAYLCPEAVIEHVGGASTPDRAYRPLLADSRWLFVRKHWHPARQGLLVVACAGVFVWNLVYAALRVAFSPRSLGAKRRLLADHWNGTMLNGLVRSVTRAGHDYS